MFDPHIDRADSGGCLNGKMVIEKNEDVEKKSPEGMERTLKSRYTNYFISSSSAASNQGRRVEKERRCETRSKVRKEGGSISQSGKKNKTHLSLLRGPFPISIPIINNLITTRIPNFSRSMRKSTIGRPLDLVTCRLGYQEWFGASGIFVVVDTFSGVI